MFKMAKEESPALEVRSHFPNLIWRQKTTLFISRKNSTGWWYVGARWRFPHRNLQRGIGALGESPRQLRIPRTRGPFRVFHHCCSNVICNSISAIYFHLISYTTRSLLEREELVSIRWELWEVSVLIAAFAIAQFAYYSCLPYLLKMSSATALNLGLLASDYYAIVAGIVFFGYKVTKNAFSCCCDRPMTIYNIFLTFLSLLYLWHA